MILGIAIRRKERAAYASSTVSNQVLMTFFARHLRQIKTRYRCSELTAIVGIEPTSYESESYMLAFTPYRNRKYLVAFQRQHLSRKLIIHQRQENVKGFFKKNQCHRAAMAFPS